MARVTELDIVALYKILVIKGRFAIPLINHACEKCRQNSCLYCKHYDEVRILGFIDHSLGNIQFYIFEVGVLNEHRKQKIKTHPKRGTFQLLLLQFKLMLYGMMTLHQEIPSSSIMCIYTM